LRSGLARKGLRAPRSNCGTESSSPRFSPSSSGRRALPSYSSASPRARIQRAGLGANPFRCRSARIRPCTDQTCRRAASRLAARESHFAERHAVHMDFSSPQAPARHHIVVTDVHSGWVCSLGLSLRRCEPDQVQRDSRLPRSQPLARAPWESHLGRPSLHVKVSRTPRVERKKDLTQRTQRMGGGRRANIARLRRANVLPASSAKPLRPLR